MSHTDTESFNPKLTPIWHHQMKFYRLLMSSTDFFFYFFHMRTNVWAHLETNLVLKKKKKRVMVS